MIEVASFAMIVPTLCVGTQPEPLQRFGTRSVLERVPTQSVGTI